MTEKEFKYEFLPSVEFPKTAYAGNRTMRISNDHRLRKVDNVEFDMIKLELIVKDKTKAFNHCISLPRDMTPEQWANIYSIVNNMLKK